MPLDTGDIAIFPLNAVLFPGGRLPLRVFEQRYMEMTKACLREDAPFGVCLIRAGVEVGAPATPEEVGCLARIVEWDMQQLGLLHIATRGERRFRIIERRVQDDGLTRAAIELLPSDEDAPLPAELGSCADLLKKVVAEHGDKLIQPPHRYDSCSWVSARLTEILPVPLAAKQKLMELDDSRQRLEILHKFLQQHRLAPQG